MSPGIVEIAAAGIFAVALLHTFSTRWFQHLAHVNPAHAGLWHLLGEVEVVFGFWAMVLLLFLTAYQGGAAALHYLESQRLTEPAFIFVIMVIAASRPILDLASTLLQALARTLPFSPGFAYYLTVLIVGPLLGSLITEPAAMTLSALLLRGRFFGAAAPITFKYATIGVLFVNVSIGGTLTPFAAPPVGNTALPWMNRFGWSCARRLASTTEVFGSAPMRVVPMTWPAPWNCSSGRCVTSVAPSLANASWWMRRASASPAFV